MSDKLFKLPLFAKTKQIKELPGQERGRVFMITEAIKPQPEKGMGYVVELAGPRKVKILGWLALGGAVYACDEPLSDCPDRASECGMSKNDEGDIFFYVRHEGKVLKTVRFSQREKDGRFTVTKSMNDMGSYGTGAYDIDEMGAACFLTQWLLPQERGESISTVTVGDILDDLVASSYPDALDALMYRGGKEGASGFERFAARSLVDADAELVRPIAATHDIGIRRLASTGLFWTACDKTELTDAQIDTLQAVEGALNRLLFTERYLGKETSPLVEGLSEEACEHAALSSLQLFASVAERLMRGCDLPSDYVSLLGSDASRGGEWDLRTRFATAAEGLRAPFGFDYLFDCDAASGVFSIHVTVPASGAFPGSDERARNDARTTYALRLAMTLASIAFGSGVGVIRAFVTVRERSLSGDAVMSLEFSRQLFTMEVVPAVQSGALLDDGLAPDDLIEKLSLRAMRIKTGECGELLPIEPLDAGLPDRSVKMADDQRPLPASLVDILRADTVADLDIFDTDDDPLRNRYTEIHDRAGDSSTSGEAASVASELVDLISAYDAADMLQESDAHPLYCVNMISRIIVGEHDGDASTRYRKIPDTVYDARSMLCRLYREQGNVEDAIRLGEELVRLAPTSFSAYHSLALSLREAGRESDAAQALMDGLHVAADPNDIACAYYRLGFLFWQGGDPSLGLACYTLVGRNSYFYGETQSEIQELMQQSHVSRRPDIDEARALLRADGVPVAPVPRLAELSARAAIALVDAGIFNASASLVHFLSSIDVGPNSFDVLASVRRSLTQG